MAHPVLCVGDGHVYGTPGDCLLACLAAYIPTRLRVEYCPPIDRPAHPPQTHTTHSYIADLNANITSLPSLGPYSKYEVPEENVRGRLEFAWIGEVRSFTFLRLRVCLIVVRREEMYVVM